MVYIAMEPLQFFFTSLSVKDPKNVFRTLQTAWNPWFMSGMKSYYIINKIFQFLTMEHGVINRLHANTSGFVYKSKGRNQL